MPMKVTAGHLAPHVGADGGRMPLERAQLRDHAAVLAQVSGVEQFAQLALHER